jgi:glycine dehydrogenase subunit 1
MSLLGPDGLERVAAASHANTNTLVEQLTAIKGAARMFNRPVFHEAVLRLDAPVADVLKQLEAARIVGGLDLKPYYPELGNALLVCATETRTAADIARYADQLKSALGAKITRDAKATTPA